MINTTTLIKNCSKCLEQKSADCFYPDKRASDGLCSQCSICMNKSVRKWQKKNPKNVKEAVKKYRQTDKYRITKSKNTNVYRNTIKGYLQEVFHHIRQRCTNPCVHNYSCYGGRGIRNKFISLDDFRSYVINELQVDPRGLEIHRIDNDKHYEKGNIKFITSIEHRSL